MDRWLNIKENFKRDIYKVVSATFVILSLIALYQQYKTNVLLNDIKIELGKH
jgi:hypothetical protein